MKKILKILLYLLFPRLKKGASVLMYHSVDTNKAFFNVTPNDFERHMRYLHERGFKVVPLSELFRMVSEGKDVSSVVSVTFDDGYVSVLKNALPILRKYDIHASLFISSGLLGTIYMTSDGTALPICSLEDFKACDGFSHLELLSHTRNHHELTRLSKDEIANELSEDISFLTALAPTPKIVAYPRGKFSRVAVGVLKEHGWVGAVTTMPGLFSPHTDRLLVPRNFVGAPTSFLEFKTLLSDGIDYYARLRLWFLGLSRKS